MVQRQTASRSCTPDPRLHDRRHDLFSPGFYLQEPDDPDVVDELPAAPRHRHSKEDGGENRTGSQTYPPVTTPKLEQAL